MRRKNKRLRQGVSVIREGGRGGNGVTMRGKGMGDLLGLCTTIRSTNQSRQDMQGAMRGGGGCNLDEGSPWQLILSPEITGRYRGKEGSMEKGKIRKSKDKRKEISRLLTERRN